MRIIACILLLTLVSSAFSQTPDRPKLVVGIVVDQMCYDYLYRFYDRFGKDGFRKLMERGTNCRNTQYNYVPTYTGPGHASVYTGTTPTNHGIVANEWYDRSTGKLMNCVEDSTVLPVGAAESPYGFCSPKNLLANTITDQLKLVSPQSKVISVSIKDRGAILPGGHLSDGSYWFDFQSGQFISSTFYMNQLPDWMQTFNKSAYPAGYMTQVWNTLYPVSSYQNPDDTPYEKVMPGKTAPVFPYDLKAISGDEPNYALFTYTPFANTVLTDLALSALKNEQLGQDEVCDMLCISFSTPDIAGHAFGPYSVEMEDMYLRLDREIARLLKELEKQVGKNDFVLFLTADHAVVPVPKFLTDHQLPGGYVYLSEPMKRLDSLVTAKFGVPLILTEENNNIYLDHAIIRSEGLDKREVEDFIVREIRSWPGIKYAYTSEELAGPELFYDWHQMVKIGYMPARSGDVVFLLEPGFLPKGKESETSHQGTSHGSSFNYDTHVPLLWFGKGIERQEIFEHVNITDITATLTHMLNLAKPNATTGTPILRLINAYH